MAIAATVVKREKGGRQLNAVLTLVPSGTYPTGGDVIDFAPVVGFTSRQPDKVNIDGKAGFIYQYDLANKKMLVYCNTAGGANAALGEHTNAGYVAGVTGDTISAEVMWFA